jgi:hypothetical protein
MQRWSAVLVLVGACGGGGGGPDAASGADADPPDARGPSPADEIGFVAGEPLSSGEWLVLTQWDLPDAIIAVPTSAPDADPLVLFTADRIWSSGVARDGSELFFSSNDPHQAEHFGLEIGDAIQNTFRFAGGAVSFVPASGTWENVNDECFADDGDHVLVCRRYDFVDEPAFSFSGWRLGRLAKAGGAFTFLRDEDPGTWELNPQRVGGAIVYERRARPPASGSSVWSIAASGAETMIAALASRPNVSPDGAGFVYARTDDQSRLWSRSLAGGDEPRLVSPTLGAGATAWSPDGNAVYYTVYDDALVCDHVEVVTRSPAGWSAPVRVRDCAVTGEFLVDIAVVTIP